MTDIPVFTQKDPAQRGDLTLLLVFVPCLLVLISVAMLGQLAGIHWKSWLPGAENMGNVYSGAKAAVYTFMSHIT